MDMRRLRKCADTLIVTGALVLCGVFAAGAVNSCEAGSVYAPASYTVVLDAGHGGADGGAVGVNGTVEAGLNLDVALMVEHELTAAGCEVIMTRTDENALADTKSADMQARARVLALPSDAVVSIHMNKFTDRSVKGSMAFYMNGSEEGKKLAQSVINAVTDATGQGRRLANPGDYFVIRECSTPAVLVECGFLSNAQEEALLLDAQYRKTLAAGIAAGVMEYLSNRDVHPSPAA